MAYVQGMGRSSILFISFLLSVDYGIRVGTYTALATLVIQALMCKLSTKWFFYHSKNIDRYTKIFVPLVFLAITLPIALYTTVNHLKYYARILFFLSSAVFVLVILSVIFVEQTQSDFAEHCSQKIYELNLMEMQKPNLLNTISFLTQVPNISAQYNLDTFLI